MNTRKLVDKLTVEMMLSRGWKTGESPIEWDATRDDSQYSLIREDVDFIVCSLKREGRLKKKPKGVLSRLLRLPRSR